VDINPLSHGYWQNIFFSSVGGLLTLVIVSFSVLKFFNQMKTHLLVLALIS
jgi:hypothetical protein